MTALEVTITVDTSTVEVEEEHPAVVWDEICEQWVSYDIDEIPHWAETQDEAKAKAVEATNIFLEHLAKCPTDEALLAFSHDWEDEPQNFICNGIF